MRYIGNKTRLLSFLLRTLRRLDIEPGVAHDAFAGTAAVGRALKRRGWAVASSDIMTYSYVFQQAYVVAPKPNGLASLAAVEPALRGRTRSLAAVGAYLAREAESEPGFITTQYSPVGGRMYFTEENARRIDAARTTLGRWRAGGHICDAAFFILLAGLIEGADRIANTAGVYAAWMKRWQVNTRRPLQIIPARPARGAATATAECDDAAAVARRLGAVDLLYIDPPYNTRQYSTYYHIPEIIARGWWGAPLVLRGKTGLLPKTVLRSNWCSARRGPTALRELLAATGARHVLVSYNSDGILRDATIRAALASAAVDGQVRRFTRRYRRYRADSDREGRRYRDDRLQEWLYYARLRE
jgi:adenine-specific DNA-methyltransferase